MSQLQARRTEKIREITGEFKQTRETEGLLAALGMLARLAKEVLFFQGDCHLYARPLAPSFAVDTTKGLSFQWGTLADLGLFQDVQQQSDVAWYRELLEQQRSCLMAIKEGKLAAYGWFSTQVEPALERTYVPLSEGDIYIFDLYTLPDFRRQGIQGRLVKEMLNLAGAEGYKRALSLVSIDNIPSIRLHEKLGFEVLSRFRKIRFLGFVRFTFRPNIFGKAGDIIRWL